MDKDKRDICCTNNDKKCKPKKKCCCIKYIILSVVIIILIVLIIIINICNNNTSTEGTIIPYSSDNERFVVLTTNPPDVPSQIVLVGNGDSVMVAPPIGPNQSTIDLTGLALPWESSIIMPRDGKITSIYASFETAVQTGFRETNTTLTARLYVANTTSHIYTAIPGAQVNLLPVLNGVYNARTMLTGSLTNISIDVNEGQKLLLVYYLKSATPDVDSVEIDGVATGSINIQ